MPQTKKDDTNDAVQILRQENSDLKKEVAQIRTLMGQMAQHLSAQGLLTPEEVRKEVPLEEQPWYIKPGSDRHAQLLGLIDDSESESGWGLSDPTVWGPVASAKFLQLVLDQKVNELESSVPQMQSVAPLSPHFAIPMWVPID